MANSRPLVLPMIRDAQTSTVVCTWENGAEEGTFRPLKWTWGHFGKTGIRNTYGNPLQYSCLENLMDKGAWQDTVHGVTKNWTRLKWLRTACIKYSWWWTGKPGMLQSMGLQRVRYDWETELNWISKDQFKWPVSKCTCFWFSWLSILIIVKNLAHQYSSECSCSHPTVFHCKVSGRIYW